MAVKSGPSSPFQSPTFDRDLSIAVDDDIGAASISPAGRDVVLASKSGLRIIDLDNPYSLPLFIRDSSSWDVADVQWSPFATRAEWIASTQNQNALVYNLNMAYSHNKPPIEFKLRAHARAITDINFSAHHPELLATCGVDSFVFVHDLRSHRAAQHAVQKFADWEAGATQVKWNRRNDKIIASAHDKYLHIWDLRKGSTPLSTIIAHSTKIYGIDWNRSDESKILTCSLDSTIKLWSDVGKTTNISTPHHAIVTNYPVWRARHTPFPSGILAMPQRGNSNLWLYKPNIDSVSRITSKHAYVVTGHEPEAQVREFLWRFRGSTDHDVDNREFQLVSWGTDRHLRLHRLSPELLQRTVGFSKGAPIVEKWKSTRKGARYITFANGPGATAPTKTSMPIIPSLSRSERKGNLSTLINYSRLTGVIPPSNGVEVISRETMTAQPVRQKGEGNSVVTGLSWISGVKFGNRHNSINNVNAKPSQGSEEQQHEKQAYQEQNDLGAEIAFVGNKYSKLTFEQIDVPGRIVTVSFNGPWGEYNPEIEDYKLVFLRFTIKFPATYPKNRTIKNRDHDHNDLPVSVPCPLDIQFERTTAPLSKDVQDSLISKMKLIADTCAREEHEALEVVLAYALGVRSLDASIDLIEVDDLAHVDFGSAPGDSSSEDESNEEGEFNNDVMQSSHTNANIPLPVQCTVRFSGCGFLILARVPSTKTVPGLESVGLRITRDLRRGYTKESIFESYNRFIARQDEDSHSESDSSDQSSLGSWETSSSRSSSSSSNRLNERAGRPLMAWQKAFSQYLPRHSVPSSTGAVAKPVKTKSVVTILSSAVDDFVPSKRFLAEQYQIYGSGPSICQHNSDVARKHGLDDLADIWMLCKLILGNEVPLDILPQTHRRDQVLVLAQRALVRIKRKDSGLDLQFDEADTVTNPKLQGRVKWGEHTVVSSLIPAIFDHFERVADIQMLAMLSCIFAEPAAREGVTSSIAKMRQSQLPMSMEAPAFSLDYFSSSDAAWSLFRPTISIPSTPAYSRFATPVNEPGWQRHARNLDTYGSHGSSNGPWGSDTVNSEPNTPFTTDDTPPILSRASTIRSAQTAGHTPYSTSPEQSHTALKKSSTTNFANAMAALSRPFANAASTSPPIKSRMEDLSTSAPTSVVTWGTTTFYGGDSQDRRSLAPSQSKSGKRASFGQSERVDVNYISESNSENDWVNEDGLGFKTALGINTPYIPKKEADDGDSIESLKMTLKNQDQFDDEACVSKPLLDSSKDWLYRAWREQYAELLNCWGLVTARAEVLKFNGLVSYFPSEVPRTTSKAGSMCLTLKKGRDSESGRPAARHTSRVSMSMLSAPEGTVERSPSASPRNFSFNPEAREFQPGTSAFTPDDLLETLPELVIPTEQYLQLSIPASDHSVKAPEDFEEPDSPIPQSKLLTQPSRVSRPSLSRGTSNVSGTPSWHSASGRLKSAPVSLATTAVATTTTSSKPKTAYDHVYKCTICWVRITGRFYLCPICGHVAHFECMDESYSLLNLVSDDCLVGCSCGCGTEPEIDDRSRMEAYLEGVRAANKAGVAWSDDAETWMPGTPAQDAMTEDGDWMTGNVSKMSGEGSYRVGNVGASKRVGKKGGASGIGTGDGGRESTNPSPTPMMMTAENNNNSNTIATTTTTTTKKKKKSKKKKTRASGLSYY